MHRNWCLGYLALDHVADLEMCFNFVPWVGGELLHAERNAGYLHPRRERLHRLRRLFTTSDG